MKTKHDLLKSIRRWLAFFIIALLLSGITAFPLQAELSMLIGYKYLFGKNIGEFLVRVNDAISYINVEHPFLAYGTDWLAFAHIVIAIAFYGPYQNPVRNVWVIEFGMIACLLVFPLAFVCGHIRNIPLVWQLVDCSFGALGIIPLVIVHRKIRKLEALLIHDKTRPTYELT